MITPLAYADSLRIGSVDFVSPDEIKVLLDIEAPSDIALNAGIPRPFPRINSYVLIPCESGFLVSQIEWITIERSQYPKRKGMQDFGVIDLPYPLRKMSLNPLGILKEKRKLSNGSSVYSFSRGVEIYPTVGDPVLLPSQDQLKAIVESGETGGSISGLVHWQVMRWYQLILIVCLEGIWRSWGIQAVVNLVQLPELFVGQLKLPDIIKRIARLIRQKILSIQDS